MEDYNNEVKKVIEDLVRIFVDGSHYETKNPYTRPEVKQAMKFLRENFYPEVISWLDVKI